MSRYDRLSVTNALNLAIRQIHLLEMEACYHGRGTSYQYYSLNLERVLGVWLFGIRAHVVGGEIPLR